MSVSGYSPLPPGVLVLDRIELDGSAPFAPWLERWRRRAAAGELVEFVLASDHSHALAIASSSPSSAPRRHVQLELEP